MLHFFIIFFVIGSALLSVAKSDFKCFGEKLSHLGNNIDEFFEENKEANCRDRQQAFIDAIQHAIDECSVPVSTDSMESLIHELCQPGSELYNIFEESATCLHLNSIHNIACKQLARMDSNLPVKEACLKMKRDFFTCSANRIGGSCGGEKVVKALLRVYETSDALTNGLCDEIASSRSTSLSYLTTEPTTSLSSSVVFVDLVYNESFPMSRYSSSSTTKFSAAGYLSWVAFAVVVLTVFIM